MYHKIPFRDGPVKVGRPQKVSFFASRAISNVQVPKQFFSARSFYDDSCLQQIVQLSLNIFCRNQINLKQKILRELYDQHTVLSNSFLVVLNTVQILNVPLWTRAVWRSRKDTHAMWPKRHFVTIAMSICSGMLLDKNLHFIFTGLEWGQLRQGEPSECWNVQDDYSDLYVVFEPK